MATKNIVPREDNEGSIGTLLKGWALGVFTQLKLRGVDVETALISKEPSLGNPDENNQFLSSTISGERLWVDAPDSPIEIKAGSITTTAGEWKSIIFKVPFIDDNYAITLGVGKDTTDIVPLAQWGFKEATGFKIYADQVFIVDWTAIESTLATTEDYYENESEESHPDIMLSGAGLPMNGLWEYNGIVSGKVSYIFNALGSDIHWDEQDGWLITFTGTLRYTSPSPTEFPWEATFSTTENGLEPPPTITPI